MNLRDDKGEAIMIVPWAVRPRVACMRGQGGSAAAPDL